MAVEKVLNCYSDFIYLSVSFLRGISEFNNKNRESIVQRHVLYTDIVSSFKTVFMLQGFKIKLFCDVYEET